MKNTAELYYVFTILTGVLVLHRDTTAEGVKQTDENHGLFENCQTVEISASIIIINCSHYVIGKNDKINLANIDSRVTTLDMSNMRIQNAVQVKNINYLQNLVFLNLSNNEFVEVDEVLKDINEDTIRHVDLKRNRLIKIPYCTPRILTMDIKYNEITELNIEDDILKACRKLKRLYLGGNLIEVVHFQCELTEINYSLEVLDLSSNRIKKIDNCAFNRLHSLLNLNLSKNSIEYLHESIFTDKTVLEILDLSHNALEFIPMETMAMLKDLKFLDLSHNKLHVIPNVISMTDWLDVSFNNIKTLPESMSSVLYPQSVFLLGGNPFDCKCDLLWLKELFDTRKYLLKFLKSVDKVKFIPFCESPVQLKGATWDKLEDTAFKCSGIEEQETLLIKENIENVLLGKDLIEASAIEETFVELQWNIPPDLSKSVELTYHLFGKKKDSKVIVLPSTVTSYRLKNLLRGAPYVICLKVTLSSELTDCIEVVTKDTERLGWSAQVVAVIQACLNFCYINSRFDVFAVSIGLFTLIYVIFLREPSA